MQNWISGLVFSTGGKYLVAMAATFIASKLGLEQGSVEGILTQLVAVVMAAWGMWESSKSKVVVNGQRVLVKDLSATEKATVTNIVKNN